MSQYVTLFFFNTLVSLCLGLDLIFTRSIQAPDVTFQKSIILVNGNFPGPTLTYKIGDIVNINVFNELMEMETLSVHWHGIDQIDTPWSDGTSGITNCPINYGSNHTYNFKVNEAGTYWYHGHVASRRGEGGYGFFIVEDDITNPSYDEDIPTYDEELHIILSDWYHQEADYIQAGLLSYGPTVAASNGNPSTGFTWPGNGQAILVNGKGGNQNVYLDVIPNKIYRVRLLNAAMLAFYNFAIANHNLTLVTTGSQITNNVSLMSIDIGTAQRYDFLIDTYDKPIESYQIQIQSNWRGRDTTLAGIFNSVYLRYSGSTTISQIQPMNQVKDWNEQFIQISSKDTVDIPTPTHELYFNMSQQYTDPHTYYGLDYTGKDKNGYLRWTVNQLSNIMPSTPLLLASYYNLLDADHYGNASLPLSIKFNDVIQIIIQNRVALNGNCEQHPWHLHGNDFWVVGSGEGEYISGVSKLNKLTNPLKIDTVVNYPTSYSNSRDNPNVSPNSANAHKPCGWTAIRFQASNIGLWSFHCHIEWHLTLGMGLIFDVDTKSLWEDKGYHLPSNYEYCGCITSQTVNPRISNANDDTTFNGNDDDDNGKKITFDIGIFVVIIIFTSIGSCLLAYIIYILIPLKINLNSFMNQTTASTYTISDISTNHENDDIVYNASNRFDERI